MYHTQGFWGLESNPNANTINSTFNSFSNLTVVVVTVVVLLLVLLLLPVKKGFG